MTYSSQQDIALFYDGLPPPQPNHLLPPVTNCKKPLAASRDGLPSRNRPLPIATHDRQMDAFPELSAPNLALTEVAFPYQTLAGKRGEETLRKRRRRRNPSALDGKNPSNPGWLSSATRTVNLFCRSVTCAWRLGAHLVVHDGEQIQLPEGAGGWGSLGSGGSAGDSRDPDNWLQKARYKSPPGGTLCGATVSTASSHSACCARANACSAGSGRM